MGRRFFFFLDCEKFYIALDYYQDSIFIQNRQIGPPIYNYNPTLPDLELEGSVLDSFRLKSNSGTPDMLAITWEVNRNNLKIEWKL